MRKLLRSLLVSVSLLAASLVVGAGMPPLDVTVTGEGGKVAYRGKTAGDGTFATGSLQPGKYVVQMNSKAPAVKGSQYAAVVSAGTKKVSANAIAGEKLSGVGVAMKVDVGAGLKITGQIAAAGGALKPGMVWIPPMLGSNQPGHWVEEGSAEHAASKSRGVMRKEGVQGLQEKGRGAPNGG